MKQLYKTFVLDIRLMIQKPKKPIIKVVIRFYMACLANIWGKNTCIFLEKLADLESKTEWFMGSKTGPFCRGKQGFSKSKYNDCNGSGFA